MNSSLSKGLTKYQQVSDFIIEEIEKGVFKKGDQIPSINQMAKQYCLSRDTVMFSYNELKLKGIITSLPGKGYFIESTQISHKLNVFLMFDEFNAFKEVLYNSFINSLKGRVNIDTYFHFFNKQVFINLIKENLDKYTTYIIMPVNFTGIKDIISRIKGQVFILDQFNPELGDEYTALYQNFSKDVYNALQSGIEKIRKYKKLVFVYPGGKEPKSQVNGFKKFIKDTKFNSAIIKSFKKYQIKKGEVYIVPKDSDLVTLIKYAKKNELKIGKDTGIISYNDTPLKEVVANGITTISTDFHKMGKTLAKIIFEKKKTLIENPSSLITRNSL